MSSRATSRSHRRQKSSSGARNTKGSVPEPVEPGSTTPPSSPPQETYMLAATLKAAMADEQQLNDSDSNSNGTRKDQNRGNDRNRNRQPSQRHQDSDQSTGSRRHRTSSRNREERGRSREDPQRRTPSQGRGERDRSKEDSNRRTPSQTREEKGRSSEDRSRRTASQQRREREKDRSTEDREDRHRRIPSQSRQQRQRREPSIERQQQQQQQQPAQQHQPQFQFNVDEPDGRDSRPTELGSLQDFGSPDMSESYTATMPQEMEQEQPISWGRRFRVRVMMMATVPRLQANWIVLALTSAMAWLALIPAYVFWGKTLGVAYYNPSYSFFLGATVSTTLTAIWQSFCPLIVQMSQTALLPRIINHPITQTAVLVISIILTVLNFLSWIILASDGAGAKTNCQTGVFSDVEGYALQCRGVNTAIVINAFVFLFWMPIALIIICGIMERGLWWWDNSGGQEVEMAVTESNPELVSEFDRKSVVARSMILYTPRPGELIPPPSPAFVTPVAIHRRLAGTGSSRRRDIESGNVGFTTPAQYRQPTRQQQQQQQLQPQLQVPGASSSLSVSSSQSQMRDQKGSTTSLVPSLSQRFSSFFGQGWGNGAMPPPNDSEPSPPQRQQNRGEPSRLRESHRRTPSDASRRRQESDKASYHGDGYLTQWHNRRNDEWS